MVMAGSQARHPPGHPRGSRTARLGRFLGLFGFLLALTAAGSLAVYWILSVFET